MNYLNKSEQLLAQLRQKILEGHWKTRLPPERELARELSVSRWSLRPALHELQKEGLIGERSQKGTLLTPKEIAPSPHQPSVGVIISNKAIIDEGRILNMLYGIQQQLQLRHVRMEIHRVAYPTGNRQPAGLKEIIQQNDHDCWALIAPTLSIQAWCHKNQIPAMVIGLGAPEYPIPYVGLDHLAICRHAVNEMLRRGHRNLALILPNIEKGEDRESRLGFLEGIKESSVSNICYSIESHQQSRTSVFRLVDRLLLAKPRPTAWLICRQCHFCQVFTYLLTKGVRIPQDVSIISRDWDSYYAVLYPNPAHYQFPLQSRVNQYVRTILKVISGQARPGENIRMIPDFYAGMTLSEAPKS